MRLMLHKARLQGIDVRDQNNHLFDMSQTSAFGGAWSNCTFTNCDFAVSDFRTVTFEDCRFTDCDFRATNFSSSRLRHVRFEHCDLRQCAFAETHPLDDVTFEECQLQKASFFNSTVRSARFLRSNLHGADLRFIEATGYVTFEGSNLWGAHVQLGCHFFRGVFDERQCQQFTAMVARVHPTVEGATILREQAGNQYRVVSRLMDDREGGAEEKAS